LRADDTDGGVKPLNVEPLNVEPSNEDQDRNQKSGPEANGRKSLLRSRGRSLEITGLGVIACFVVAFASLVGDGTIQLSQYLIFLAMMLISAGGMVWRIVRLTPRPQPIAVERLAPGAYRVSFRGR
jgi:hypothetical protein